VESANVQVEIVCALPERTLSLEAGFAAGATVASALDYAARQPVFSGMDLNAATVGIFGRIVAREQLLRSGDRLEIYRPLAADPKTARRKRVASKSGRS
jgi:putative ubiquitin-RnfH superfamily antitoxin RatB of RatAB toxin-antitoxin module